MIKVIKCPKHLLGVLDSIKYKRISSHKNGFYLSSKDQIFYVSQYDYINALSIQIGQYDLEQIRFMQGDNLLINFVLDKGTEIVDISFRQTKEQVDLRKISGLIEKINPQTGLNGDMTNLLENYKTLVNIKPLENPDKIIGRGLGLTPSGDDISLGIIFFLFITGNKKVLEDYVGKIKKENTNRISGEFLSFANRGIFSEPLLDLIYDNQNIEENIKRIIRIGNTSGADSLLGLYYGIKNIK